MEQSLHKMPPQLLSPLLSQRLKPIVFAISLTLTMQGCSDEEPAIANAPIADLSPELQEGLAHAISATPYTALVQLKSHTQKIDADGHPQEIRIDYIADVIETIRGATYEQISFYQIIEEGEEPMAMQAPVIITLCHDASGYFWPGTGSVFPSSEQVIHFAKSVAKTSVEEENMNAHCF